MKKLALIIALSPLNSLAADLACPTLLSNSDEMRIKAKVKLYPHLYDYKTLKEAKLKSMCLKGEEPDKSAAQLNLEVLDGLCVQNYEDFSSIKRISSVFGGKPVPHSFVNADPAMRNMGGESYIIPYEGKQFIVGYAEGGGCTVISRNIDHKRLAKLLVKNYEAILVHTETGGAQISEMFKITGNTLHKGAMFSLVYGKRATGFAEGSIGFIPAEIVNKVKDR